MEATAVTDKLEVTLRYGEIEKTISGNSDEVLRELITFLSEVLPTFQLASKLSLTVDIDELLTSLVGVMAVTPEGVVVTAATDKLTDKEIMLLHLLKMKVAYLTGKAPSETLRSSDLVVFSNRTPGTVAGRLSELCAENLVQRIGKGEYRITTLGIQRFSEDVLTKLKRNET